MVYLPLCEVADTPFHIQGDVMLCQSQGRWFTIKINFWSNVLFAVIEIFEVPPPREQKVTTELIDKFANCGVPGRRFP